MPALVGNSSDITIIIRDGGECILAGVQSYSVKCDLDYTKIDAIGEVQPTDYYVNGRTYTITLNRVHLLNSTLSDGLSFYNKKKFKDFQLIINKRATEAGASDRVSVFRNCYAIDSGEDGDVNNFVQDRITIVSHNLGYESDDKKYKRLKKMKYGSFSFPNNPSSSDYSSDRKYVEHKFPGLKNNDIEDFGANGGVISCSGYFYGSDAFKSWNALLKEYKKKGVKKVYHPILSISKGLMVNLKCSIDKHSSLVQYSFDILEYNPPAVSGTKKKSATKKKSSSNGSGHSKSTKKSGKVKSKKDLKVGSSVYVTGHVYKTATGISKGKSYNHKKMTVTKINGSGSHPVHMGTAGWVAVSELSWS